MDLRNVKKAYAQNLQELTDTEDEARFLEDTVGVGGICAKPTATAAPATGHGFTVPCPPKTR